MFHTTKIMCRGCDTNGPFKIEYFQGNQGVKPAEAECMNCGKVTKSGAAIKEMEINFIRKWTAGEIEISAGVRFRLALMVMRGALLESSRLALASGESG